MPTENTPNRRLAAILFADVVGYTALMQDNEKKASLLLDKFLATMNKMVTNYNGKIVNNYGDGCVCTFESAVSAVECAKEIQLDFQKDLIVPVRIGIHSGDVFYKEDNVFGDSVNVASRIESMGIPGAILVSKRVRDVVKNQPDMLLPSLGTFEFKNVEEPIEVFAVANEGFAVPRKEEMKGKFKEKTSSRKKWLVLGVVAALVLAMGAFWQMNNKDGFSLDNALSLEPDSTLPKEVREKRVAVMVFENQTMNADFDVFGVMASDFITQGLMEHSNAKVVSAANKKSDVQLASIGRTELAKETGAEVIVQGRYYMRESNLLLHANIVDAYSGEVIHALEPLQGSKDDPMTILDDLQQELLGYWILKDEKWVGKNPPKFNAYQEYLKALDHWQLDQKKTEEHLIKAFEYDSTYYQPLLKLAVNYINFGENQLADTTLQFLTSKSPSLSRFEQLRLKAVKARLKGDRAAKEEEAATYLKMHEEYNIFGLNVVQGYRNLGRYQDCIDTFERFFTIDQVESGLVSSIYLADYLFSHFKLGRYEEVIQIMDSINTKLEFFTAPITHLKTLVRLNRMSEVDEYLKKYSQQKYTGFRGKPVHPSMYYFNVINELYLMHEDELIEKYANEMPDIQAADSEVYQVFPWMHYAVSFMEGDYQATHQQYQSELIENKQYGELVILLTKLGNHEKAQEYLSKMEELASDHELYLYGKAVVMLALGDKEKATELAIESHERGVTFYQGSFSDDRRFRDLQGYPAFEEFVKPK